MISQPINPSQSQSQSDTQSLKQATKTSGNGRRLPRSLYRLQHKPNRNRQNPQHPPRPSKPHKARGHTKQLRRSPASYPLRGRQNHPRRRLQESALTAMRPECLSLRDRRRVCIWGVEDCSSRFVSSPSPTFPRKEGRRREEFTSSLCSASTYCGKLGCRNVCGR